jgi:hypothetical protein
LLKTARLTPKPTPSVKETMTKKKVKSATKS